MVWMGKVNALTSPESAFFARILLTVTRDGLSYYRPEKVWQYGGEKCRRNWRGDCARWRWRLWGLHRRRLPRRSAYTELHMPTRSDSTNPRRQRYLVGCDCRSMTRRIRSSPSSSIPMRRISPRQITFVNYGVSITTGAGAGGDHPGRQHHPRQRLRAA